MIPINSTILFQGDFITDCGRSKEDTTSHLTYALGSGYACMAAAEPPLTLPELDGKGVTQGVFQGSGKPDIGSRFLKLPAVDCGKITK